MYHFKDPAGAARWATIALYLFLATTLVSAVTLFAEGRMGGVGALLGGRLVLHSHRQSVQAL